MSDISIQDAVKRFANAGARTPECERAGDSWEAFLKHYRITNVVSENTRQHRVTSVSGKTYAVSLLDKRSDGVGIFPAMYLTCECEARGGNCRHRDAVYQMLCAEAIAVEDYDQADWLERVEIPEHHERPAKTSKWRICSLCRGGGRAASSDGSVRSCGGCNGKGRIRS